MELPMEALEEIYFGYPKAFFEYPMAPAWVSNRSFGYLDGPM